MFVCSLFVFFFFFKQKTAYEMRISDWSSDVCSSDLMFTHAPFTDMPQSVGIHAPLPTYPAEPALHWATITPPPQEPHHVQSHSFVFDGPELIAPEGLSAIVGFQQQRQQPTQSVLTPDRVVSTVPPFDQPQPDRTVELLPAQRAVSSASMQLDM